MMKNLTLTWLACLIVSFAFAQKATVTTRSAAQTPDTAKVAPKHIKIQIVGEGKMRSDSDVVQNISKSKDHTVFTKSITRCRLTETLKSRGPITVFAPTNEAFGKLKQGTLDTLFKRRHNTDLVQLLTYHAINGRFTVKQIAKKIKDGKGEATFETLTGAKLRARLNDDKDVVLIDEHNNEAVILITDIIQNNGLVDVISAVLIPKAR